MKGWTKADAARIEQEASDVSRRIAELMDAGVPARDPRTLEAVAGDHAWIRHFWTPDRESYIGLGQLYVDDARFKARTTRSAPASPNTCAMPWPRTPTPD